MGEHPKGKIIWNKGRVLLYFSKFIKKPFLYRRAFLYWKSQDLEKFGSYNENLALSWNVSMGRRIILT